MRSNARRTLLVLVAITGVSVVTVNDSQLALEQRLREMYGENLGEIRYFASSVDLNSDGRPEIVVHVMGPMVCGSGGCNTLTFLKEGEGLRLVTDITITRPPIIAAGTKTHGWKDLIVFVSGGGILPGYHARLRFDGQSYPHNPTVEPAEPAKKPLRGNILIKPFRSFREGKLLRPGSKKEPRF
jgi:hypothetical protein